MTAVKELSGEERITLNKVGETGVLQLLEQVVNVQRSTGGKTRGSRTHDVFKARTLLFLSSSHSYDIVQTLALQECPTRTESPLQRNASAGMFTWDDLVLILTVISIGQLCEKVECMALLLVFSRLEAKVISCLPRLPCMKN